MKDNSTLEAVQTRPSLISLFEKKTCTMIAQYFISPYASLMNNAQLTSDIIEAYENYYRSIQKRMNT